MVACCPFVCTACRMRDLAGLSLLFFWSFWFMSWLWTAFVEHSDIKCNANMFKIYAHMYVCSGQWICKYFIQFIYLIFKSWEGTRVAAILWYIAEQLNAIGQRDVKSTDADVDIRRYTYTYIHIYIYIAASSRL